MHGGIFPKFREGGRPGLKGVGKGHGSHLRIGGGLKSTKVEAPSDAQLKVGALQKAIGALKRPKKL